MADEWQGAARPMSPGAMARTAAQLGCAEAALRAVWQVESAGRAFRRDGSLERRFEPHHMPRATWAQVGFDPGGLAPWRASLRITTPAREAMFARAVQIDRAAALRATSWGAPQIMGFNAAKAGFGSASEMVRAMANSEESHLDAFAAFVRSQGLDRHLRAQDWRSFAAGYNGNGQAAIYARRIEAAFRAQTGAASPVVLRLGDEGPAVQRLQAVLGLVEDGGFGPVTEAAVRDFQAGAGLPVDGVVGARTWAALEAQGARPLAKPGRSDDIIDRGGDWIVKGGGAVILAEAARETGVLDNLPGPPPALVALAWWIGAALALGALAVYLWRRSRS